MNSTNLVHLALQTDVFTRFPQRVILKGTRSAYQIHYRVVLTF